MLKQNYILSNGIKISKIGLGIWKAPDGEKCFKGSKDFEINNEDMAYHDKKSFKNNFKLYLGYTNI